MIYVVFVEANHQEISVLARTMKNFGLMNLTMINPCEIKNESYYQAMHARDIVRTKNTIDLNKFLKYAEIDSTIGTTGSAGGSYRS